MTGTFLADRAVIRLSPDKAGESATDFLQALVTQDVTGTLPVWAALLTPQGKCLFDFLVWADGDDRLIDCEASRVDALIRRLTLYRLRRAITISRDTTVGVHWQPSGAAGVPDPRLGDIGRRWIAATPDDPADASDAYRAHRLTLGVTEGLAELGDGTTLWLECNAAELNGVSFTKGCYVGQENTARMNWRSTVNRRLCVVPADMADPERVRAAYPALNLSVEHRRVADIPPAAWRLWMGDR